MALTVASFKEDMLAKCWGLHRGHADETRQIMIFDAEKIIRRTDHAAQRATKAIHDWLLTSTV